MTHMTKTSIPVFDFQVGVDTGGHPDDLYALVSDLPQCGAWSAECRGGRWVDGQPGQVGAVFEGDNFRVAEVVAWAPVVRGDWKTQAEVVVADRPRRFCWAMRDRAGRAQRSVWGFDIEPHPAGSVLTHHFRMKSLTEGMRSITSGMTDDEKAQFFREWGQKVEHDLQTTAERVRSLF